MEFNYQEIKKLALQKRLEKILSNERLEIAYSQIVQKVTKAASKGEMAITIPFNIREKECLQLIDYLRNIGFNAAYTLMDNAVELISVTDNPGCLLKIWWWEV